MQVTNLKKLKPKKLVVFDLDGTIARTKSPMDQQMANLLAKLLEVKKVAVISGGKLGIFKIQLLNPLETSKKSLENLFLFPTTGTRFYRYRKGWKNIYAHQFTKQEVAQVMAAFKKTLKDINYVHPKKLYGKVIENRANSQITFSALGQDVVKQLGKKGVKMKEEWTRKNTPVKMQIAKLLAKQIPKLEVRAAGFTSIDVTKKGIDKAYGLKQMEKHLKVKIKDMLFIGDAIFPGGNDYAVTKTPIDYIKVKSPVDTKKVIRQILNG